VQRPHIAEAVERDLEVLDEIARAIESRTTWGADYGVRELTSEVAERLREELDFRTETRNATEIAAHLPPDSPVRVPTVHPAMTTSRVLVMEWLDGVSIRDSDAIDELSVDRTKLAGDGTS